MGSGKKQTVGYRYYFGIHMGIGRGPIDELHEVRVGDRTAWAGKVDTNTTITIDAYDLFGGEAKEGGVQGPLEVMLGADDQVASAGLTTMLGLPIPGFRRMFTVFYNGLVSMNNPYPKAWKFRFNRTLKGWDGPVFQPTLAVIGLGDVATTYNTPVFNYPLNAPGGANTGPASLSPLTLPSASIHYEGDAVELSNIDPDDPFGITLGVAGLVDSPTLENFDKLEFGIDLSEHEIAMNSVNTALNFGLFRLAWNYINYVNLPGSPGNQASSYLLQYGHYFGTHQFQLYFVDAYTNETVVVPLGNPGSIRFRVVHDNQLRRIEFYVNSTLVLSRSYPNFAGSVRSFQLYQCGGVAYGAPNPDADSYRIRVRNLRLFGTTSDNIKAMNPAHIIYECLTNREWGRGMAQSKLDEASFTVAAAALVAEGFGLCMKWTRKDSIQSFVQVVLDHIGATLYQSRITGLMTLKLIRADYDIDTLPALTTETGLLEVREANLGSSGSSVNAVTVKWHDPVTDEDRTVGVKNTAGVLRNGGAVNSTSKDYTGVPIAALALRLAQRDLRATSTNLRRFSLVADRTLDVVHPGDVLVIQDPKRGIPKMAVRVGKVKDGTLTNGQITLDVIQDVFALPAVGFAVEVPSTYTPPDTKPCIDQQRAFEAPYFMLAGRMTPADLAYVKDEGGFVMAVASKGKPINQGIQLAVRDSAFTPDDNPPDGSFVCTP